jgi:hypothetical protein
VLGVGWVRWICGIIKSLQAAAPCVWLADEVIELIVWGELAKVLIEPVRETVNASNVPHPQGYLISEVAIGFIDQM